MTTVFLIISGGAVVAALGWKAAYWMGRTRGYEEGKAEATEHAFADATDLMDTLLAAQEAL